MKATIEWLDGVLVRCLACEEPLVEGELVLPDASGAFMHAACCGPERESYVKDLESGEPLGDGDPIPAGEPWPIVASPEDRRLKAVLDVLGERLRQIDGEGWTSEHDDEHASGELARAAAAYAIWDAAPERVKAMWAGLYPGQPPRPDFWPWSGAWWKPTDARANLVRAGALILAEIERLDRQACREPRHG